MEEIKIIKGMEYLDDSNDARYVLEDQGDNEYIHLTGYESTCMCESWYTADELDEMGWHLSGKIVKVEELDQDYFIINCTCCDSD